MMIQMMRGMFRKSMFISKIKEKHSENKVNGDPMEVMPVTKTNNKE